MIDVKTLPNKDEESYTTSHKFKQDLIEFFKNKNLESCLEVGTSRGYSTLVLSHLFDFVTTVDWDENNLNFAKFVCKDRKNIEFLQKDVYKWDWDLPNHDVVFIDCAHDYNSVKQDYNNACDLEPKYIVFDDYGLPEKDPAVKECVDYILRQTNYWNAKSIGMKPGTSLRRGKILRDHEGMILCRV